MTDDFSFFHIWLASVEFRREKTSTWHVASNLLLQSKTYKFFFSIILELPGGIVNALDLQ